jgi:hypothetical protein
MVYFRIDKPEDFDQMLEIVAESMGYKPDKYYRPSQQAFHMKETDHQMTR